jgi:hypothetical protein
MLNKLVGAGLGELPLAISKYLKDNFLPSTLRWYLSNIRAFPLLAKSKFPYALITEDYGILNSDDLETNSCIARPTTFSGKATTTASYRAPKYEFPDDDNKSYISWDPIGATVDVVVAGTETVKIGAAQTTFFNPLQSNGFVSAGPINSGTHSVTCGAIASRSINTGTYSITSGPITSGAISTGTNGITSGPITSGAISTGTNTITAGPATCSTLTLTNQSNLRARVGNSPTITSGVATTLTFDRIDSVTADAYFLPDNKTIQFGNNGRYYMSLRVHWSSNSTGYRSQVIQGSGGTQYAYTQGPAVAGASTIIQTGDYGSFTTNSVSCIVAQNSGSDLTVTYAVLDIFRLC